MSRSREKVLQYLDEAHASELGLTRVLQSQILMTPNGRYRSALESHLRETRDHARRLELRMAALGKGRDPLQSIVGFAESTFGQVLALGKAPLDLVRGSGGEEKVLKNAKDTCATEAWEIATYTALERLARAAGDAETAELAVSIRGEEERMYDRVLREIPGLTDAVMRADVKGNGSYQLTETGAADAARRARSTAKRSAGNAQGKARRGARSARRAPGVARAEGQIKGLVASADDLPIPNYDKLTAGEIVDRLPELSQVDLAKVEAYERRNQKRTTILARISALKGREPWPGYDELTAEEVRATLRDADEEALKRVRGYERGHKNRSSVIEATERERAHA
jgi:ferritin-like metal-binding protein YciE